MSLSFFRSSNFSSDQNTTIHKVSCANWRLCCSKDRLASSTAWSESNVPRGLLHARPLISMMSLKFPIVKTVTGDHRILTSIVSSTNLKYDFGKIS